ncbi:NTP transferase domain-containing protein [Kamptonema cortianum]|nr:NTP transferase domain-containing protein [Kamptonema cortianum]
MNLSNWGVVIPAGGLVADPLATHIGTARKALASIQNRHIIEWTLDAVLTAGFQNISVISGEDVREVVGDEFWVQEFPGQIDNAVAGVERLGEVERILFLPADTPFIHAEGLIHFVNSVESRCEDLTSPWFAAGICPNETFRATFPDFPTPYLKLKDGDYVSGAYYAASKSGFLQGVEIFKQLSESRKSQFKMLLKLGVLPLIRYFLHLVTIQEAETRLGKVFGGQAIVISDCDPHAMADIDTVEDFENVMRFAPEILSASSS